MCFSTNSGESDDDYVSDMKEAYHDRMEQVAEEMAAMKADDDEADALVESELTHHGGVCAFCASRVGRSDFGRWLSHMSGAVGHEFSEGDLYTVSRTLAFLDDDGRRQLGMFALVGDAAITLAVVDKAFDLRFSKSKASDARTKCTAWTALAKVFVDRVPKGFVQFPAGVDPGSTRSGGEALEALAGLVFRDLGTLHSSLFVKNVGVYSSYKF